MASSCKKSKCKKPKSKKAGDTECSICLENINKKDMRKLTCDHCYHDSCIEEWFRVEEKEMAEENKNTTAEKILHLDSLSEHSTYIKNHTKHDMNYSFTLYFNDCGKFSCPLCRAQYNMGKKILAKMVFLGYNEEYHDYICDVNDLLRYIPMYILLGGNDKFKKVIDNVEATILDSPHEILEFHMLGCQCYHSTCPGYIIVEKSKCPLCYEVKAEDNNTHNYKLVHLNSSWIQHYLVRYKNEMMKQEFDVDINKIKEENKKFLEDEKKEKDKSKKRKICPDGRVLFND